MPKSEVSQLLSELYASHSAEIFKLRNELHSAKLKITELQGKIVLKDKEINRLKDFCKID